MNRRWLYYIFIVVFLVIVATRFTEAEQFITTVSRGHPRWLLVSLMVQCVYYVVFTGMFQSALWTVDIPSRLIELIPVWFTSVFLNITAPSAGLTGAAVFIDDAIRRGYSGARAAAGMVLVLAADYTGFAVLLIAGLAYLFATRHLYAYQIIASLILLAVIAGLSGVLLLGLWRPAMLRRLLNWIQATLLRIATRLNRGPWLRDEWAEHSTAEFSEAAAAIKAHPGRLARTYFMALLAHLLEMTTLFTLFKVFEVPIHPGVVVAGYGVGILFWLVSFTPSGIGVVEGVMALVLTTLGVPLASAAVITLAFRGFTFWLPLTIGFILMRRTRSFGSVR